MAREFNSSDLDRSRQNVTSDECSMLRMKLLHLIKTLFDKEKKRAFISRSLVLILKRQLISTTTKDLVLTVDIFFLFY
jgi:hypothetical protein